MSEEQRLVDRLLNEAENSCTEKAIVCLIEVCESQQRQINDLVAQIKNLKGLSI